MQRLGNQSGKRLLRQGRRSRLYILGETGSAAHLAVALYNEQVILLQFEHCTRFF